MKNTISKLLALILVFALSFSFAGCSLFQQSGTGDGDGTGDGTNNGDNEVVDIPDELLGITEDTISVGNTAGTTGALSTIGAPFNLGIEAAFAAYNKAGGYNGKKIALKHYDDGGVASNSVSLLDKLIFEDEVFAIVGHFGSYAVDVTLDTLKDEKVPMIYAAAGNGSLLNENAQTAGDKAIFPVQPLNVTEGRVLALRAFAPADKGGLAATKVGVISNSNEASQALLSGIKAEAKDSGLNNIVYQDVASADYTAAVNALKNEGCDTIILTVIGADFLTALTAIADASYYSNVLTSYNNATAAVFNVNNMLAEQYQSIFTTVNLFAQAWLDITSTTYMYSEETPLLKAYEALYTALEVPFAGSVAGFNEAYWEVAENIYDYAVTVDPATALAMSYDSYALAGYIAGDLFCQAMEALEKSGKALSRANLVAVMESQEFQIAMADKISFANGMRSGVQSFGLTSIFDIYNLDASLGGGVYHQASSATIYSLTSIEDYRAILAGK